MINLQNFLLQASIQVLVFAIGLLAITAVVRFAMRRRASEIIALGMGVMVVLWFAAMLPLPGWLESVLPEPNLSAVNADSEPVVDPAVASSSADSLSASEIVQPTNELTSESPFRSFIGGFVDDLARGQSNLNSARDSVGANESVTSRLPGWLVVVCSMFISLGVVRFLTAIVMLRRSTSHARPIGDSRATGCLAAVSEAIGCKKRIALKEIEDGFAPFTFGLGKATIFLPIDWRVWSDEQLRATLAHEVAHVQNGDYFKRLLAQFAVALNFYNPLVHWLAKQLVVEQEVSADDLAAMAVGGRQPFLKVLAELALAKEYPKSRLVPMFLPTRKTFFRRIEMLRKEKTGPSRSRLSFVITASLTLMIGVAVVGLRLPAVANAASDDVEPTATVAKVVIQEEANLAYVNADADYFIVLRPAAIYSAVGDMIDGVVTSETGSEPGDWKEGIQDWFHIEVEKMDQLTIVGDVSDSNPNPMASTYVIQTNADVDWLNKDGLAARMKEKFGATPGETFREVPTFECNRGAGKPMTPQMAMRNNMTFAVVDSKTLIMSFGGDLKSNRIRMRAALRQAGGPTGDALNGWKSYSKHMVSFQASSDLIEIASAEMAGHEGRDPMSSIMRSVMQDINMVSGGMSLNESLKMDLRANCANEQGVTKLTQATSMVQLFAKSFSESESVEGLHGDDMKGIQELVGALSESISTKAEGNDFVASIGLEGEKAVKIQKLLPLVRASRAGARRVDSMNRCRQLVIAMHNYHDANGTLPPAVLTSDSGKKYSWRVALLPYLEKQDLYDAYRFDEEWNSEHNKKITANVPDVFQHPGNKEYGTPNSCYFVIVGDETPFKDGKKTSLEVIADGTSRTFCIVEANMGIHWAEPKDIPLDTPDLISKLGGVDGGGFVAALCDGSTQFYRNDMDPATFKALITSNGGEMFDFSDAWKRQ